MKDQKRDQDAERMRALLTRRGAERTRRPRPCAPGGRPAGGATGVAASPPG